MGNSYAADAGVGGVKLAVSPSARVHSIGEFRCTTADDTTGCPVVSVSRRSDLPPT